MIRKSGYTSGSTRAKDIVLPANAGGPAAGVAIGRCSTCGQVRTLCERCRLPVNMSLVGGVRDDRGLPYHDVCLAYERHLVGSEGDDDDAE